MDMMITEEHDARNRRLIAGSLRAMMGLELTAEPRRLLRDGTPEERAAYVHKQNKYLFFLGVVAVAGYFILTALFPRKPVPPPPAPVFSAAGQIQSLQLHDAAFSTSTTVITDTGTFQVFGGVSASNGDAVSLKREFQPLEQLSLCVASKIKSKCYRLL